MEITTTTIENQTSLRRRAAINTLALIGFIVLIIIGIALAVYSARYVPKAVTRIGSAAVSLSGIFKSNEEPAQLAVVATSTLSFEESVIIATSTETKTTEKAATPVRGTTTTRVVTTTVPANLYGKPDLAVTITSVGYLSNGDNTDSFVASSRVPDNKQGAVQFTVVNNGTNVSDEWKFKAEIPTTRSFTYTSPTQPSLKPGDSIAYTLGFNRTKSGNDREISIIVDTGRDVDESNEGNNEDTEEIDIKK